MGVRNISLSARSLRHKLNVIFSLVSVIPLLICGYLISYYFLVMGRDVGQMSIIIVIGLIVILTGWRLGKEIIEAVIKMSEHAEAISKGHLQEIEINRGDELGELGESLNRMASQIKQNIHELQSHLEKIEELTITDELTNLYNQRYMKGRLAEEIERAITFQHPCSLILLRIENLEQYRERDLLPDVALLLKRNADNVDKVGRWDERKFMLILPEKSKKRAVEIAEKIKREIADLREGLKVSIGVSSNPLDGNSAEGVLNKAEIALEEAGREGGVSVKVA
ncbi:MAG: hypothetical protein DRP75_02740 [Candidatus Omnitrophota bacterium]|nr:MAG: hypothetical protein DRP75_02740 [Candidatus Omnitrophota bacterium]